MCDGGGTSLPEVLRVLDVLSRAGCMPHVVGGWGVDALVGRQTRAHRDLDVAVDARCEKAALEALRFLGYEVETDWRPVRVEVAAPGGRRVDLHPVVFDDAGDGLQAGPDGAHFRYPASEFVAGSLDGHDVPCLSVDQQLLFHSGYERRAVDIGDIALLQELQHRKARQDGPDG